MTGAGNAVASSLRACGEVTAGMPVREGRLCRVLLPLQAATTPDANATLSTTPNPTVELRAPVRGAPEILNVLPATLSHATLPHAI